MFGLPRRNSDCFDENLECFSAILRSVVVSVRPTHRNLPPRNFCESLHHLLEAVLGCHTQRLLEMWVEPLRRKFSNSLFERPIVQKQFGLGGVLPDCKSERVLAVAVCFEDSISI